MRRTALMAGLALAGGIGIGGGLTEFLHAQPQLMRHTPLVTQDLTGLVGKEGVLVKVEYAPGASDTKHAHPEYLFIMSRRSVRTITGM